MDCLNGKGEIYIITCTYNNKRYIGQARCYIKPAKGKPLKHGTEGRWKQHLNAAKKRPQKGSTALYNAMNKYGSNSFTIKTLHVCDEKHLNYFEAKYIRQYNTLTPHGYNLKAGGSSARWTDDVKLKMSATKKGVPKPIGYSTLMRNIKRSNKVENLTLPEYLYHYKDASKGVEGYRVLNHPVLPNKVFVDRTLSMDNKLCLAKEYLKTASTYRDEDRITHKRLSNETLDLPKYVYFRKSKFDARCGYIVKYPNAPCKVFCSAKDNLYEKRNKAIEYLNSINRERFID